jgi:hypothetical protein
MWHNPRRNLMAISQLKGINFKIDGPVVDFFGAKGTILSGDRWGVNAFGGDPFFPTNHDSMMPAIQGCINDDVEAGNEDRLSMVLLAPLSAVIFFLEGRLTRQHLDTAVEGPDFIDIPYVDIDGRGLRVRILRESEYNVATADSEGNVL